MGRGGSSCVGVARFALGGLTRDWVRSAAQSAVSGDPKVVTGHPCAHPFQISSDLGWAAPICGFGPICPCSSFDCFALWSAWVGRGGCVVGFRLLSVIPHTAAPPLAMGNMSLTPYCDV